MTKEIAKQEKQEINLQDLFSEAIKTGNVETVERLMRIREEIKKEKAKQEFDEALKNFQNEIKPIRMDCTVRNKDGTIRYAYASYKQIIKEIKPILAKYGLSVSFDTLPTQENRLKIACIISHVGGHKEIRNFEIPTDTSAYMTDIQKWGSTLTYAKRYALISALNLIAEEDTDGLQAKETERENEIKIKKITILEDGTVVERKEEEKKIETKQVKVTQQQTQDNKQDNKQQEQQKQTEQTIEIDKEKSKIMTDIRKNYKKLLEKYSRQELESYIQLLYDVKLEELITLPVDKLKAVQQTFEEEVKNL